MSKHLALITPWPPQHTGIADYALDLVQGLIEQGFLVTVITEAEPLRPLPGVDFFPPSWLNDETEKGFDQLIYQIGNNSDFHIFQLPLLMRYPGVVHLHDMVLHHLMAWLLYIHGSTQMYRTVVARWYGPKIAQDAWDMLNTGRAIWDSPGVMDVPFFEEILQHASALIVNSKGSANKVKSVFPNFSTKVLPQLYREVIAKRPSSRPDFHIGVFGGIDPNKQINIIIEAVSSAILGGCSIQLHLAGSINIQCRGLIDSIVESRFADRMHVHGRIGHDAFLRMISEVDLCIALRYPTMGETSAIVMRALQAGTPVIVNDVGWYSELPDFVPKLVPGSAHEREQLTDLLKTLSGKGSEYRKLLDATKQWTESELQFGAVVKEYADFALSIGRQ